MASPTTQRLQILGAAALFSSGGAVIKAIDLGNWQVACIRSCIAAAMLGLLVPRWRRGWRPSTFAIGAAYAATLVLYVSANKLTTAANTIFLQSTAPVYVLLAGPRLLGERLRRDDVGFAALIGVGMLLFFVGRDAPQITAPNPTLGNLLAATAGITWAITLLGMRRLGRDTAAGRSEAAGRAVVCGNLIAGCACAPLAFPGAPIGATDWALLTFLGVFQIGLAYIWMTNGVRGVPAFEVSLLLLLEPVLNTLWAWLSLGETPGPWSLAGCALILAATLGKTLVRSPP